MSRPVRMFALLVMLVTMIGCRGATGNYHLSYKVSHGNANAPPGTSRGRTATLAYRDYGGILSKFLLLFGNPTQLKTYTDCRPGGGPCSVWTTQRDIDEAVEKSDAYRDSVFMRQRQAEAVLEYSSESLGGDTRGIRIGLSKVLGSFGRTSFSFGGVVATATMRGRTRRVLVGAADSVMIEENTDELSSAVVGIPLRLMVITPGDFLLSYSYEWNVLQYFETSSYAPSISRILLEKVLAKVIRVGVDLQIDGMRAESSSIGVEAGLAF